ncbi:helix-turn-helix domain-containing protein [Rhodococcus sp. NPDC003382]
MSIQNVHDDRAVLSLTADEVEQARAFNERLHASRSTSGDTKTCTLSVTSPGGEVLSFPSELTGRLGHMLDIVSRGGTVTVGSLPAEVTTTTAAKMLGISRPTLMKLIREDALPAHEQGSHTRLLSKDVFEYREKQTAKQSEAFERLRALEGELGIED